MALWDKKRNLIAYINEINPEVDPTQEFRFAVVMYGGVSLAIYINGITQELLELVKSTAPAKSTVPNSRVIPAYFATEELSASGKVYRNPPRD